MIKTELDAREGQLIREHHCVIKFVAGRTKQQHIDENRELINAKNKIWYENRKEDLKQHKKEYYDKNREQILLQKKEYSMKNADAIKRRHQEWREKNIEQIREKARMKVTCECGQIITKIIKSDTDVQLSIKNG